ncbi:glycosyltransferase [uncultured Mycolicibacterium sp.]|uniref:glycosyltransferase n=1 Tax=uncultured Mycolicibacterium sp. TaxID=2320817 RepID=UPI0026112AF4|nr:glycosyltransferase [uncultured Mycolicibacterium sp.]
MDTSDPLRIAVVSVPGAGPTDRSRGAHVAELVAALARRGHTVTTHPAPAPDRPDADPLEAIGVLARTLDAEWRRQRPDVVHAHGWAAGVAAQLAATALDLPTVLTLHAPAPPERADPSQRARLESKLARTARWIAATCTDEIGELIRLGRPRTGTSVLPGGVNLERFTPDGPRDPRTAPHRIVGVGPAVPDSGFDLLVRALPAVPHTELVLATGPADGPYPQRLRRIAAEVGVADRLRFTDPDPTPALLRSADVVACTPHYDPHGRTALAAMACAVPVAATAVGALRDTVVHDVTGKLVEHHHPAEVAVALNQLVRDEFGRRCLGAAGRDRASARYGWNRIAADAERIYLDVAGVRCP